MSLKYIYDMNAVNFLSKASQSELKNRYHAALLENGEDGKPIWDEKMAKWCTNQIKIFFPICGGKFVCGIEKFDIKKDFWFGYSSCGQGPEWEECMESVNNCYKNLADYFMSENLSAIDKAISDLNIMIENNNTVYDSLRCPWEAYHAPHYYRETEDNAAHTVTFLHFARIIEDAKYCRGEKMTVEDLIIYRDAYIAFRDIVKKQLETYLKKYGTSKLTVDSYWIDR